jgi:ArsR family transcriptional regulator, arsenate/arsenite/antimonite-responsive transcriptional repressor
VSDDERRAAAVFAALGHPTRIAACQLLLPLGAKGLPGAVIAVRLEAAPSDVVHHLRQMARAGVLVERQEEYQIVYAVSRPYVNAAIEVLFGGRS